MSDLLCPVCRHKFSEYYLQQHLPCRDTFPDNYYQNHGDDYTEEDKRIDYMIRSTP